MADLDFRVLGPLEVRRDGGQVAINGPKLRVVLAALLLRANATVSVHQLAQQLWGERMPATARKSTQLYVLRLRRVLGDGGSSPTLIQTRPDGYLLRVRPEQLDLLQFRQFTAAAARAGEPAAELELLDRALACWRGPALAGVPSDVLQREAAAELAEDRLRVLERRVQAYLDLDRHREIIGELVQLTKDHPWQETLWTQLITALHRADWLADALDTYREVHRRFRDELGIDPGPQLRQLHSTILGGSTEPVAPQHAVTVNQLPADVHGFVGRADVLTNVAGAPWRVTVISGPPGVGKTALALHLAHLLRDRFPDGQLYVNLQGYAVDPPLTPATALARFLGALGVGRDRIPAETADRAALYRSVLAGRKMLLLLDNAVDAEQVRALLPGHTGCQVLITSRSDLRGLVVHPGALPVPLGVLTEAESRVVLTDLVGEARAATEPDALVELARACAYLPLALRIAGANLAADPYRPIAGYVAEMRESGRLAELAIDGDESTAIRVAFDQSYLRLQPGDRKLFRLLGLAPGPDIGVAAAAALADVPPAEAVRVLDRLVAAALVHRHARGRYQLHDLIREYAAGRAETEDDTTAALTRLADFYLHTAAAATRLLYPGTARLPLPVHTTLTDERAASRWLDDEHGNLMAVVARTAARPELCRYSWQLVDALRGYLQTRGHIRESFAGYQAALGAAERQGDRRAQLSMLDVLGTLSYNLSDYDRAIVCHQAALDVAGQIGDLDALAQALHHLGRIHAQQGRPTLAEDCHRQALTASRKNGNRAGEVLALIYIGVAHTSSGRPRTAVHLHRRALALSEETGNRDAANRALQNLGIAYWNLGELDKAVEHHDKVLAYCRETGERFGEMAALVCLAETHCDAGRHDVAMAFAQNAVATSVRHGDRRTEANALEVIATIRSRRGEHAAAIEGYTDALGLARDIGYGETSIMLGLAAAHRGHGNPDVALHCAEHALDLLRRDSQLLLEASALTEVAAAHFDLGAHSTATRCLDQAISKAIMRGQRLAEDRAMRLYRSSMMEMSGGAPTRTGGPQNPAPLVTYNHVLSTWDNPAVAGC